MKTYRRILLALELFEETDKKIVNLAAKLNKHFNADLFLVHAIEFVSDYAPYGMGLGLDMEVDLLKNAKKEMQSVGKKLKVPLKNQLVDIGPAKSIILEAADKIKADLIIVGSHGRSGISALLGSTANSVLHGAKCDVLSIRF